MNKKKQNNYKKEISIPLFIPISVIIIFIIIFINISNSNSTVIANTNEERIETNNKKELEIPEVSESEEEMILAVQNEESEENEESENPISDVTENTNEKTATYTVDGVQYTTVGVLNIPSLGIEYPILSETTPQLLKVSITKYWGAYPNEVGNMVVVGHNYKNNKFFSNLLNIEQGAIVKITDLTGKTLDYKVYDTYVIDPYDNSCTSQLTNGQTEITLITCYYENGSAHANKRFVVKARAY